MGLRAGRGPEQTEDTLTEAVVEVVRERKALKHFFRLRMQLFKGVLRCRHQLGARDAEMIVKVRCRTELRFNPRLYERCNRRFARVFAANEHKKDHLLCLSGVGAVVQSA